MTYDKVIKKIKLAIKNDDPQVIIDIMEEPIDDSTVRDELVEILHDEMKNIMKNNKVKIFQFLKDNDIGSEIIWGVDVVKIEHHTIDIWKKSGGVEIGSMENCIINEDGNIVLDKDKIEELCQDVDFDEEVGSICWSAQHGGFESEIHMASEEELLSTAQKFGFDDKLTS